MGKRGPSARRVGLSHHLWSLLYHFGKNNSQGLSSVDARDVNVSSDDASDVTAAASSIAESSSLSTSTLASTAPTETIDELLMETATEVLVFSKYEAFSHAFIQHEIETISKYNIYNRSPNFEIDSNINTFLNTFTSEKDLLARIL